MPRVEIFQNKKTRDIVLSQFVFCKELGGGDAATGPLVHMPFDDFIKNCADIVTEQFEVFYTRDYDIKSELYNEMTKSERKKFLSQHTKVSIAQPFKDGYVNVRIGHDDDLYGKLDYPFDKATFGDYLREALAKAT